MLQNAQDFFKRHPKAKACHVVLDRVFENLGAARAYRKFVNAHCVTSYLRSELKSINKTNNLKDGSSNGNNGAG